jgi:hypothetical protein
MGLKPSMMDLGAVALRVADGGTTRAFDRTNHPVEFVFYPKTHTKQRCYRMSSWLIPRMQTPCWV